MKEIRRTGVLYSRGPHFRRLLKYLRAKYPAAEITAFIPEGFPEDFLEGLADVLRNTGIDVEGETGGSTATALLRQIRSEHFDLFVVMFASPKLRLFAALSGARERCCFGPDGRFYPVHFQPLRMVTGAVFRRVRGRLLWLRIRHSVYHFPIEKK